MASKKKRSKFDRLEVVMKKVKDIIPYENNPRKNESTALKLKRMIDRLGIKDPIVLDENDVIVCGHARLKACMMLGMEEVPCTYAYGLTQDEIDAYRIADNKTAEAAGWNYDKLVEEMKKLAEIGFELDFSGFNEAEQLYYAEQDATPDKQDKEEFKQYEADAEATVIQSYNVAIVCESREDREYLANLIKETKRLKRFYLGAEIRAMAQAATA